MLRQFWVMLHCYYLLPLFLWKYHLYPRADSTEWWAENLNIRMYTLKQATAVHWESSENSWRLAQEILLLPTYSGIIDYLIFSARHTVNQYLSHLLCGIYPTRPTEPESTLLPLILIQKERSDRMTIQTSKWIIPKNPSKCWTTSLKKKRGAFMAVCATHYHNYI